MTASRKTAELLAIRNLSVTYRTGRHHELAAVRDVSFSIGQNETVGLVGESGSGKSTIGRAILGLATPSAGSVTFAGRDLTIMSMKQRRVLASDLQVVFQDPYSSLNPARTIGQTLAESIRYRRNVMSNTEIRARVHSALEQVGLSAGAEARYPAHFSGGQRQRIAIARTLMGEPRLIICDEPVSALDLSVQAQVLNLLNDLQSRLNLSYLFISHDLDVVRHMSRRIVVLYRGMIMEEGSAEQIYANPGHPYTRVLLQSALLPNPKLQRERSTAPRTVSAEAHELPDSAGCPFAARCVHAVDVCVQTRPTLEETPRGVRVACHRWRDIKLLDAGTQVPASPARFKTSAQR